jgi:hypothetical protein
MRSPSVPPTPAQLAGARRELARRPPAILADLDGLGGLPGPVERAVRRVEDLYPRVAAAVPHRLVLVAGAQQPPAGSCRWCLALVTARRNRTRLRLTDPATRAILGPPCPRCRLVLDPPKPKPAPRRAARSSTTRTPAPATRRRVLVAAAHPAPGITPNLAAYNAAAMRRLGMDPARAPHLTRATTTASRGRR